MENLLCKVFTHVPYVMDGKKPLTLTNPSSRSRLEGGTWHCSDAPRGCFEYVTWWPWYTPWASKNPMWGTVTMPWWENLKDFEKYDIHGNLSSLQIRSRSHGYQPGTLFNITSFTSFWPWFWQFFPWNHPYCYDLQGINSRFLPVDLILALIDTCFPPSTRWCLIDPWRREYWRVRLNIGIG